MSLTSKPSPAQIKRVPKVLLHDHLDGGLRPQTIIDMNCSNFTSTSEVLANELIKRVGCHLENTSVLETTATHTISTKPEQEQANNEDINGV